MYNSDMEKIMLKYKNKKITRAKAIRIYCKEHCCAGDTKSWSNCSFSACVLWKFRKGRESLAKPTSFTKQRKTSTFSEKNDTVQEVLE